MSKLDLTLLVIVVLQVPFVVFEFGVISLLRST